MKRRLGAILFGGAKKGERDVAFVVIQKSVGNFGVNLAPDVVAISAALVAVGPNRGGQAAPPITIYGLAEAIKAFQKFQQLPIRDGRVDPGGNTLRRMNELLNGGGVAPPPIPTNTGVLRPLQRPVSDLPDTIDNVAHSPVRASMEREVVFDWGAIEGKGKIFYFELDENVVPKWFAAIVPNDVVNFDRIHIFFHPTPAQSPEGYQDSKYQSLANWWKIFHYLSDAMGTQFCGAKTNRVLLMPLMTQGAANTCGMFPRRWESIASSIMGMLKSGDMSGGADPVRITSVVVSSFSTGITYSHHFRAGASLGARLAGVIDFDGGISSFRGLSAAIRLPPGKVVRMQQMPASTNTLGTLAAQNVFPLPKPRWAKGPFKFSKDDRTAVLQVHSVVPQALMGIAAHRIG
jgi:hypothetical protein